MARKTAKRTAKGSIRVRRTQSARQARAPQTAQSRAVHQRINEAVARGESIRRDIEQRIERGLRSGRNRAR